MFKKLFKKDTALDNGDAKTILGRIGNLSSEEKTVKGEELKSLADTHSDTAVRVASVDVLCDFDSLSSLLTHSCAETAQSAATRIARDASLRANLSRFPKLLELPHVQYSMLQYAASVKQAKALTNALSKTTGQLAGFKLVELCLDCVSDDVRQWLASQMNDLKQLQALEKASRNRNKNTNRFAREQIAKLKATRDQLSDRERECERLHAGILAMLENESKSPTPLDPRKTHLMYARLNTLHKSNMDLKADNQEALIEAPELRSDESDVTHLALLQDKLESTDRLLEQARHELDERIAEHTRQEQIQKQSESISTEPQKVSDTDIGAGTTNKPGPADDDPTQSLLISMQEQDVKNGTIRKQLDSSNSSPGVYQNLWRAQSTSLKLSKRAQSFTRKPGETLAADNAEASEQLTQLINNMDSFTGYGNTIKDALLVQFTRSLEKLDGLLLDGNMTSAVGLHADCKNKSRMLPHTSSKSLMVQFKNIDKRYNELKDWRIFAATPKQVELCEAVEQLADNVEDPLEPWEPETQAEHLKTLRKRWLKLGRANRTLNKRFDAAASRAFAPCQAYFDEQGRIRKDNLDKRKTVLAQLRNFVEENDWNNPEGAHWKAVEKILRTARSEWNSYLPIDRGKIRAVQKSFDHVCDQIHQKLASEWEKNLDQKRAYLERARTLVSAEGSLAEIINEAKTLQISWRNVGITPRGQDQRLWREFRKQSDKIFARRDEEKQKFRDQRTQLNAELLDEYKSLSSSVEQYEKDLSEKGTKDPDIKPLHSALRALRIKMSEAPRGMADKTNKLGEKLKQLEKLASTRRQEQKLDTLKALDMQLIDLENNIISGTFSKSEDLDNSWRELADRFQHRLPKKQYAELEIACKHRVNHLLTHCREADSESLQNLFDTALLAQTETVVRAEIEAGVHSGKSDDQLRMQMQVERLKSGLANRQVQTLNPERMALEWCGTQSCGADRQALSTRYFSALAALG